MKYNFCKQEIFDTFSHILKVLFGRDLLRSMMDVITLA